MEGRTDQKLPFIRETWQLLLSAFTHEYTYLWFIYDLKPYDEPVMLEKPMLSYPAKLPSQETIILESIYVDVKLV